MAAAPLLHTTQSARCYSNATLTCAPRYCVGQATRALLDVSKWIDCYFLLLTCRTHFLHAMPSVLQLFAEMNERLAPLYLGCENNREKWQELADEKTTSLATETGASAVTATSEVSGQSHLTFRTDLYHALPLALSLSCFVSMATNLFASPLIFFLLCCTLFNTWPVNPAIIPNNWPSGRTLIRDTTKVLLGSFEWHQVRSINLLLVTNLFCFWAFWEQFLWIFAAELISCFSISMCMWKYECISAWKLVRCVLWNIFTSDSAFAKCNNSHVVNNTVKYTYLRSLLCCILPVDISWLHLSDNLVFLLLLPLHPLLWLYIVQ